MKIHLPDRANIEETANADPLKFYYLPVASSFYKARFADGIRLLGPRVGRLLDFGTGSGIFLPELARHCEQLFACDLHGNLKLVGEMCGKEKIEASFARADGRFLPFADESLDAIISMSVLEHIADLNPPADEFFRVLKPGGRAVIGVPVDNLMTELMLRTSYLTLDAELDDEHVSTHRDVIRAFERKFEVGEIKHIPRGLPEIVRMYTTVAFHKRPTRGGTA